MKSEIGVRGNRKNEYALLQVELVIRYCISIDTVTIIILAFLRAKVMGKERQATKTSLIIYSGQLETIVCLRATL